MIVVKYGGNAMRDQNGSFAKAISEAIAGGVEIVIVHGGGPQINEALDNKGIKSQWLAGLRITTPEMFEIVEDVLVNNVGPTLAVSLQTAGVNAQSISGRAFPTLFAEKMILEIDGLKHDVGLVGEVTHVDPAQVLELLKSGITPVVAPISSSEDGLTGYNVNADFAAAALASALHASTLIMMTDVPGIYRNWPDQGSLIDKISVADLEQIKSTFNDGMRPKVQATLDALTYGVKSVRIIDGTNSQTFSQALAGKGGTLVMA
jgi:acetylglutamate kinase